MHGVAWARRPPPQQRRVSCDADDDAGAGAAAAYASTSTPRAWSMAELDVAGPLADQQQLHQYNYTQQQQQQPPESRRPFHLTEWDKVRAAGRQPAARAAPALARRVSAPSSLALPRTSSSSGGRVSDGGGSEAGSGVARRVSNSGGGASGGGGDGMFKTWLRSADGKEREPAIGVRHSVWRAVPAAALIQHGGSDVDGSTSSASTSSSTSSSGKAPPPTSAAAEADGSVLVAAQRLEAWRAKLLPATAKRRARAQSLEPLTSPWQTAAAKCAAVHAAMAEVKKAAVLPPPAPLLASAPSYGSTASSSSSPSSAAAGASPPPRAPQTPSPTVRAPALVPAWLSLSGGARRAASADARAMIRGANSGSGSANSSGGGAGGDAEACVLCRRGPREVVFVHAARVHRCACRACAATHAAGSACPECGERCERVLRVFVNEGAHGGSGSGSGGAAAVAVAAAPVAAAAVAPVIKVGGMAAA